MQQLGSRYPRRAISSFHLLNLPSHSPSSQLPILQLQPTLGAHTTLVLSVHSQGVLGEEQPQPEVVERPLVAAGYFYSYFCSYFCSYFYSYFYSYFCSYI